MSVVHSYHGCNTCDKWFEHDFANDDKPCWMEYAEAIRKLAPWYMRLIPGFYNFSPLPKKKHPFKNLVHIRDADRKDFKMWRRGLPVRIGRQSHDPTSEIIFEGF